MKLWTCPSPLHVGPATIRAPAPKAMDRDDVRRFCLPCSAATGKLVCRTCPTIERQKAERRRRRLDTTKRRAQAKQMEKSVVLASKPRAGEQEDLEEWREVFRANGAELVTKPAGASAEAT